MMQDPFLHDDSSISQFQQGTVLEQENAMLRIRVAELEVCQSELLKLEQAYGLLLAEVAEYRRQNAQPGLFQAKQARVEQTVKLVRANQSLQRSLERLTTNDSLTDFLGYILTEIMEQVGAGSARMYLYNSADNTLRFHIGLSNGVLYDKPRPDDPELFQALFSADITPLFRRMCKRRNIFSFNNGDFKGIEWPGVVTWYEQHHVSEAVCRALMVGDQPVGMLGLLFFTKAYLEPEDVELINALAHQSTLAIQLMRLTEEAKQAAIFEERNRLAGEIHDTLAQAFTGINVQLELARFLNEQNPVEVPSILDHIGKLAQTGLAEARRSVWTLYPETESWADLAQQLSHCLNELTARTTLQTELALHGEPYPLLPFVSKNLLRIGQEAITNALKYAQANHLWVKLTYSPEWVNLSIKDDGCGFDIQSVSSGFGLVSISERADRIGGQLTILTQPDQGTEVCIQVATKS